MGDVLRETFDWLRRAAPQVAVLRIAKQPVTTADLTEFLKGPVSAASRPVLLLSGSGNALLALLCENDEEPQRTSLASGVTELFSYLSAEQATATILHAPDWLKQRCNVWGPPRPDVPLMQRVKASFDPQNIFAPGRFVGGL